MSLQGKIKNLKVTEDFESRPHKAVTFQVQKDKERQKAREPGFSGGKMPRRSEISKEEKKNLRRLVKCGKWRRMC